jgi:hypothetical protein
MRPRAHFVAEHAVVLTAERPRRQTRSPNLKVSVTLALGWPRRISNSSATDAPRSILLKTNLQDSHDSRNVVAGIDLAVRRVGGDRTLIRWRQ